MKNLLSKIVVVTLPWRVVYWAVTKLWEDLRGININDDVKLQDVTVKDIMDYLLTKFKI